MKTNREGGPGSGPRPGQPHPHAGRAGMPGHPVQVGTILRHPKAMRPHKVEKIDDAGVHVGEMSPAAITSAGVINHERIGEWSVVTKKADIEKAEKSAEFGRKRWGPGGIGPHPQGRAAESTQTVVDVEGFDSKTKAVLEGLMDDDQDTVSLRSVGDVEHPSSSDADRPKVPAQDEDATSSSDAPWSPVSVRKARQFVKDHPEAAVDIVFPTVYEEDRTSKMRDLGTAQALGGISHRRMSEGFAKELGIDPYNYDEEMEQIADENPPIDPAKSLGSGDNVVRGLLGPLGGTPKPAMPDYMAGAVNGGGVGDGFADEEDGGQRTELSGPVQAEFRNRG